MYASEALKLLVGKTVQRVFMNEDYLKLELDQGSMVFAVSGDCCSQTVFYDFLGLTQLKAGPIVNVEELEMEECRLEDRKNYQDAIAFYGVRFTTQHPQFGPVSAVMSYRNYSNGYYGGSLEYSEFNQETNVQPELTDDCLESVPDPLRKAERET